MLEKKINKWVNEKIGRYSIGLAEVLTRRVAHPL